MEDTKAVNEPLRLYREILIPLMASSNFELVSNTIEAKHCFSRFVHKRYVLNKNITSPSFGGFEKREHVVEVVGMPTSINILILHGTALNAKVDTKDICMKIRCQNFNAKEIEQRLRDEFLNPLLAMVNLNLSELPSELKIKIMSYLPIKSLAAIALVSSEWHNLMGVEQLWKLMVEKHYPKAYETRQVGHSWQALFKEEHRRYRLIRRRELYANNHGHAFGSMLALPPLVPLLPIAAPPFMPMLPSPSFASVRPFAGPEEWTIYQPFPPPPYPHPFNGSPQM